jgi:hypothetical protein
MKTILTQIFLFLSVLHPMVAQDNLGNDVRILMRLLLGIDHLSSPK